MSDNKRIAGIVYFKIDGEQLTLNGTMSYSVNAVKREGVAGLSGVAGYKETSNIPYIEGEFLTTEEFVTENIANITNATATAELANGKTILLEQAWQSGDIVVNVAEGTCTLRFEGMRGQELS